MLMTVEEIVDGARKTAGLDEFHSESFREGLEILLRDFDRAPFVIDAGRRKIEALYISLLANRLRIDDYIRRNPAVLDQEVRRPVVVLGMPRTGTTLLSNLLGADPARRSLLKWEIYDSVPPPTTATMRTDPRYLALAEAQAKAAAAYRTHAVAHFEAADAPSECVFVHAHDVKSFFNESHATMPAYSEWVRTTDMTSAYDHHLRVLKMLQSEAPGTWNLKMPSHAYHVSHLLKAMPDARILWTHRDPYTAMGSLCSLISKAQSAYCSEPDLKGIGASFPAEMAGHLDHMLAARDEVPDQVGDVIYAELIRDPIAVMRQVYAWLGDDFTPEAEAGMRAWIAANPQGKFGKHEYNLEKFGLSVGQLDPLFAPYLDRYDLEREG
jgi:hypothetical protein